MLAAARDWMALPKCGSANPAPWAVCGDGVAGEAEDAKVGLCLGAIVEAENGFDGTDECGGQGDAAFPDAIGGAVDGLMDEGDAEGLLHGGDGSGELDGAVFGGGGAGRDGEAVFFGEGEDEFDGGGVGGVALGGTRRG